MRLTETVRRLTLWLALLLVPVAGLTQEPVLPPDQIPPEIVLPSLHSDNAVCCVLLPDVLPPPRPARTLKKPPDKYDLTKIGNRGIGKGMNFYSMSSEESLGKELSAYFDQQMRFLEDPVVYEYVNRVCQNLARSSDAKFPIKLKIVSDDEINAFSLPGGYLYVTTGLLEATESEAQLAGVIGHELAHISARHGTRTVSKAMIWSGILRIGAAAASGGGRAARVASVIGAEVGSIMIYAKMSRGAEDEADLLAVEYAYTAGYDPGEYVVLFEKVRAMQKKKPSAFGKIFASHPAMESRMAHVQRVIDDYFPDRPQYVVTSSEFGDAQSRMKSLLKRRLIKHYETEESPVLKKAPIN